MTRYLKWLSVFYLCLSIYGCASKVTYKLEILNSPVGVIAFNNTPLNYTEVDFYAYNLETEFKGYKISVGTSKDLATTNPAAAECLFSKNSNLNKPTRIQLGGTTQPGFDCFVSTIGPLNANIDWVSIKSFGVDCSQYAADAGCSPYSESSSSEVLDYIEPPLSATIQYLPAPDNYYLLTVTMGNTIPVNFTGIGLFYSQSAEEAQSKASIDGMIYDGFCNISPAPLGNAVLNIQIGGTQVGTMDGYISNFYLYSGDTLVIRNSTSRLKYPWSNPVTVTIP